MNDWGSGDKGARKQTSDQNKLSRETKRAVKPRASRLAGV